MLKDKPPQVASGAAAQETQRINELIAKINRIYIPAKLKQVIADYLHFKNDYKEEPKKGGDRLCEDTIAKDISDIITRYKAGKLNSEAKRAVELAGIIPLKLMGAGKNNGMLPLLDEQKNAKSEAYWAKQLKLVNRLRETGEWQKLLAD